MASSNISRHIECKRGVGVATVAALVAGVCVSRPAEAQVLQRFALRFEAGVGYMLSEYQRNDDPAQFRGNTKGFGTIDFQGSGRLAFQLFEPLSLQVSVNNWVFPSTTSSGTGWVFAPAGGVHIEPRVGNTGRFFVDGNVGAAFTGDDRRFYFDAALGFEFTLTRAVALGPVLRYGHVIQPDFRDDGVAERFPEDARFLTLGASLALRVPEREPEPPPRPRIDTDGDGVFDDEDLCPTVPAGDHPDPQRRGCPMPDVDGDGVFDNDDRCVTVPQGDHPDPTRPGCPDADTDNDGVLNQEDQCPTRPMGPYPDARRRGCPEDDTDRDGIVNSRDRCPNEPEIYNSIRDDDGCPDGRPLLTRVGSDIQFFRPVLFLNNSDQLVGAETFRVLDALTSFLTAHAEITLVDLQGHTDNRGPSGREAEFNLDLSRRRAERVRTYLIEHGIASDRIQAHGLGLTQPIDTNSTAAGRARNRRVVPHIVREAGEETDAPRSNTH
jgi:outer membrane protein OmpA-like peptidoglycan-associated protein